MKNIGVYKYDSGLYNALIDRLKASDIILRPLTDGEVSDEIDLYIFDLDSSKDFDEIKFDRPFAIISSLNDSMYLRKSLKAGALDYIHKPFEDVELTVKRILRILEKKEQKDFGENSAITIKNNKLIETEIKRAHRGNYPLMVASLNFEVELNSETTLRVVNKVDQMLRDSDSCLVYPNNRILLLLPFTDSQGVIVASRKIIEFTNSLGYKSYIVGAQYPNDGENMEQLINNLGKSIDTRVLYK